MATVEDAVRMGREQGRLMALQQRLTKEVDDPRITIGVVGDMAHDLDLLGISESSLFDLLLDHEVYGLFARYRYAYWQAREPQGDENRVVALVAPTVPVIDPERAKAGSYSAQAVAKRREMLRSLWKDSAADWLSRGQIQADLGQLTWTKREEEELLNDLGELVREDVLRTDCFGSVIYYRHRERELGGIR